MKPSGHASQAARGQGVVLSRGVAVCRVWRSQYAIADSDEVFIASEH
jgi:hypothetical protein